MSSRAFQLCPRCILLIGVGLVLARAPIATAGSICGTVRDVQTMAPVPRAGVFVRTTAGAYTGLHAATDSTGAYCVENVPAGTYDLEFRVDNYVTTYVRDVQVQDDVTGVDVGATPAPILRAWPNPARTRVSIQVQADEGPAPILHVFDARGRFVRGWKIQGGGRVFVWDLRDYRGSPLPAGVYFLSLRGRNNFAVTRITLIR